MSVTSSGLSLAPVSRPAYGSDGLGAGDVAAVLELPALVDEVLVDEQAWSSSATTSAVAARAATERVMRGRSFGKKTR
jgi:hypothetical protein